MILWRVITHKDDFYERQPSTARTTDFSHGWPLFANTNIIISICCVFLCFFSGMRKSRRKLHGALKKVGSSSHSRERTNIYDWTTPPSSHDDAPTETDEEQVESQRLEGASSPGTTRGGTRRLSPRHSREPRDPSLQHAEKQNLQPHPWLQWRTTRKDRYGCWFC